jgi:hypothetical protein
VFLDTAWAGLGGTQLNGIVRSASWECETGFEPDYGMGAARSDLDYYLHAVGNPVAKLSIVLSLDATGAGVIANYRANDLVFLRLKNVGSTVAVVPRHVQIDGAYRFTAAPKISGDGPRRTVAFEVETVVDPTSSNTFQIVAINGLSAVA